MKQKMDLLNKKLKDRRSGKIIFLSHCLLNENVRYMGGAFTEGIVPSIVDDIKHQGYGIVQMPCPEQCAWGGVSKKLMWLSFGIRGTPLYWLRFILLPLFQFYTRMRYRSIARHVSLQIKDYIRSGFTIIGIVGIDGSPSCGVTVRLDMEKCFRLFSSLSLDTLESDAMNEQLYGGCLGAGRGIFIYEIARALGKRKIHIPLFAHDLVNEARLKTTAP
ncbi:MAG TPA: hypothetical protein PLM53_14180 [Spirochaetota bacterium]|nr:hypothetical protein [Spirochaetota bacterium]HPC41680.1 hypothetical protein [Spirochaetota bacterium]HPL15670.1 hypothetical protein [Spirochaetota bacterium]HQF09295.1 hypothetical protein [Spirochaetota bacterium]HQH98243.1 hypothetical protein [Spirochaetota bacterium]